MTEAKVRRRIERNLELDCLLEQRDHVTIQISLALDAAPLDTRRLELLRSKLKELEHRIGAHSASEG